jgi:hypothetical protein
VLLVFGFSMISIGSWIDAGLTHDWVGENFMVSQLIEQNRPAARRSSQLPYPAEAMESGDAAR